FVAMPAGSKRASFALAVAHHHQSDQIGTVVNCPVCMRNAVSELSALVNAPWRFGRGVTTDPARKTELLEETLHPGHILTLVGIYFGVCSFQVRVRQDCRRAMSRARDEDRIQIVFID